MERIKNLDFTGFHVGEEFYKESRKIYEREIRVFHMNVQRIQLWITAVQELKVREGEKKNKPFKK